mgnify:CR=1 FL=1
MCIRDSNNFLGAVSSGDKLSIFGTKTGINLISNHPDDCVSGSFKASNMTLVNSFTMEEFANMQFRSQGDQSPTGPLSLVQNSTIAGQRTFTLPEFSNSSSAQSKYFAVTDNSDGSAAAGGDITTDAAWAAQGDLIVATANDTASVLTKGSAGEFLKVGSSTLEWGKQRWAKTWSCEWSTRQNNWYGSTDTVVGIADGGKWRYATNSTLSSGPTTWDNRNNPGFVAPFDCTIKEIVYSGITHGTETYEFACKKGVYTTAGNDWSLSLVGSVLSESTISYEQVEISSGSLSTSLNKGDMLVFFLRRTTSNNFVYKNFTGAVSVIFEI